MAEETKTERQEHSAHREHHEHHGHHGYDHRHHRRHLRVRRDVVVYVGAIWLVGWLCTIAFAGVHPFFWKGVLALIAWPYNLGSVLGLY